MRSSSNKSSNLMPFIETQTNIKEIKPKLTKKEKEFMEKARSIIKLKEKFRYSVPKVMSQSKSEPNFLNLREQNIIKDEDDKNALLEIKMKCNKLIPVKNQATKKMSTVTEYSHTHTNNLDYNTKEESLTKSMRDNRHGSVVPSQDLFSSKPEFNITIFKKLHTKCLSDNDQKEMSFIVKQKNYLSTLTKVLPKLETYPNKLKDIKAIDTLKTQKSISPLKPAVLEKGQRLSISNLQKKDKKIKFGDSISQQNSSVIDKVNTAQNITVNLKKEKSGELQKHFSTNTHNTNNNDIYNHLNTEVSLKNLTKVTGFKIDYYKEKVIEKPVKRFKYIPKNKKIMNSIMMKGLKQEEINEIKANKKNFPTVLQYQEKLMNLLKPCFSDKNLRELGLKMKEISDTEGKRKVKKLAGRWNETLKRISPYLPEYLVEKFKEF